MLIERPSPWLSIAICVFESFRGANGFDSRFPTSSCTFLPHGGGSSLDVRHRQVAPSMMLLRGSFSCWQTAKHEVEPCRTMKRDLARVDFG